MVSFVELIDAPTYGRSKPTLEDLKASHIDRLSDWVLKGRAAYIFIPKSVHRLLIKPPQFSWIPERPIAHDGSLPILFRSENKVVYSPVPSSQQPQCPLAVTIHPITPEKEAIKIFYRKWSKKGFTEGCIKVYYPLRPFSVRKKESVLLV